MSMGFRSTNCCAMQEIVSLNSHKDDGVGALKAFCKSVFGNGDGVKYHSQLARPSTMYSFYIFTAAVTTPKEEQTKDSAKEYFGGYGSGGTNYGRAFYEAIKKANVGECWMSPGRINKGFHPDHSNHVWVFMPDRDKLKVWWGLNKVETKVESIPVPMNPKEVYYIPIPITNERDLRNKRRRELYRLHKESRKEMDNLGRQVKDVYQQVVPPLAKAYYDGL